MNVDPPLNSWAKTAVIWVKRTRWKPPSKAIKNITVGRQGYDLCILRDAHAINITDYLEKGKTINIEYYMGVIDAVEGRNRKKKKKKPHQTKKKKVLFHQENAPCRTSIAKMTKLHELHTLRIASTLTVLSRLGLQQL